MMDIIVNTKYVMNLFSARLLSGSNSLNTGCISTIHAVSAVVRQKNEYPIKNSKPDSPLDHALAFAT